MKTPPAKDHKRDGTFRRGNSAAQRIDGGFDLTVKLGLTKQQWAWLCARSEELKTLTPHDLMRLAIVDRIDNWKKLGGSALAQRALDIEAAPLERRPKPSAERNRKASRLRSDPAAAC